MNKNIKPFVVEGVPKTIDDLVLSKNLYNIVSNSVKNPHQMPHLILTGPPGTGKTSSARVIANEILKNITSFNYLQINASSERGVETVRNTVYQFASNNSFTKIDAPDAPYKIVFLDEADSMTSDAQNALRNLMESYMENCRFIFSCNNYNKIIPALRSRCLKLEYEPLIKEDMKKRVTDILEKTGNFVELSENQLDHLCEESKGDFRYVYNVLNQAEHYEKIKDLEGLLNYVIQGSLKDTPSEVHKVFMLEEQTIRFNYKQIVMEICKKILSTNMKGSFLILDRLAKSEFAVMSGATEYVQFIGWYSYYRQIKENFSN